MPSQIDVVGMLTRTVRGEVQAAVHESDHLARVAGIRRQPRAKLFLESHAKSPDTVGAYWERQEPMT